MNVELVDVIIAVSFVCIGFGLGVLTGLFLVSKNRPEWDEVIEDMRLERERDMQGRRLERLMRHDKDW